MDIDVIFELLTFTHKTTPFLFRKFEFNDPDTTVERGGEVGILRRNQDYFTHTATVRD